MSGVRIGVGKVADATLRSPIEGVLVCIADDPYSDRVTFETLDDGVAMLLRDEGNLDIDDEGDAG